MEHRPARTGIPSAFRDGRTEFMTLLPVLLAAVQPLHAAECFKTCLDSHISSLYEVDAAYEKCADKPPCLNDVSPSGAGPKTEKSQQVDKAGDGETTQDVEQEAQTVDETAQDPDKQQEVPGGHQVASEGGLGTTE